MVSGICRPWEQDQIPRCGNCKNYKPNTKNDTEGACGDSGITWATALVFPNTKGLRDCYDYRHRPRR